jgi:lysophospholipase L1-like esterase
MMVVERRRVLDHCRNASVIVRALLATVAVLVASAVFKFSVTSADAQSDRGLGHWTGAWTTSMIAASPAVFGVVNWSEEGFANQSVRQVIRVSRGGSAVRIRVSNAFGTSPLHLTGASIGKAGAGASIRPKSLRPLTFERSLSTVVPVGREALSDAATLHVSPLERLTVTLYFSAPTGPATFHLLAFATSYRAAGDHRFDQPGDEFRDTTQSWYYLSGVEVAGRTAGEFGAVAAFGDSITDGAMSTRDADNRYPDELAERLVASGRPMGVLNVGISGNQVLSDAPGSGESAVVRFKRDVLDQPHLQAVIILEGINDIGISVARSGEPVSAQELINGHRALIRAAHDCGIKVIGATITPTKGTIFPAYFTEHGEAVRDAVNEWIRTSGEYDAVVDFDLALADPADPDRLRPGFNSGDGVHPNDAGMRAIAAAIDLNTL